MSSPTTIETEIIVEDVDVEEIPAEPVPLPTHVSASAPQPSSGGHMALFGTSDPVQVIEKAKVVAKALLGVVEEQALFLEKPDGKRYLNVEAWTLLASMLQVTAIPVETNKQADADGVWRPPVFEERDVTRHSNYCNNGRKGHLQTDGCETYTKTQPVMVEPGHGGYTAKVEARDQTGRLIGAAHSQCNWEEWRWRDSDAYALESMAQTRGISKALSGPLRFIVELAGFKGTPAEEVPDDGFRDRDRDSGEETYTGPRCPACKSPVYDNRAGNAKRVAEGKKAWPAFKCTNRQCAGGEAGREWATWHDNYFDETQKPTDPAVGYKTEAVEIVRANPDAWLARYQDADVDKKTKVVIASAIESDNAAQKAGILWNELAQMVTILAGGSVGDDLGPRDLRVLMLAFRRAIEQPTSDLVGCVEHADELIRMADEPETAEDLDTAFE